MDNWFNFLGVDAGYIGNFFPAILATFFKEFKQNDDISLH